jgi:hypothetical protein
MRVANEVEDEEICPENMPPSLAAGVIALILSRTEDPETVSHEAIAGVCGVSEGTLQKCLKKLEAAAAAGQIQALK